MPRACGRARCSARCVLAPVILGFHIADSDQVKPLRDHPSLAVAGAVGAVVVLAVLAVLFDRRPAWLPVAAAATLPFRVPIASGGSTANLLVPLYLVVAAGALAYAVPRLAGRERAEGGRAPGLLEWALAASLVLYAIQSTYSDDFGHALENVVFFYVPFALLFVAPGPRGVDAAPGARVPGRARRPRAGARGRRLRRVRHAPPAPEPEGHRLQPARGLLPRQLAVLRPEHLRALPGPRDDRCSSAWLLWARRQRDVVACALLLAVLWGGLVLTFSQSSFAALLVGLAVLGALRWSVRWALILSGGALVVAVAFVALAPGAVHLDLGNSKSADKATSGRYDLIKGGVKLFRDAPLVG